MFEKNRMSATYNFPTYYAVQVTTLWVLTSVFGMRTGVTPMVMVADN